MVLRVVDFKHVRYFTTLIKIDKLAIVKSGLMLVVYCVARLRQGTTTFNCCQDLQTAIFCQRLDTDWDYAGKVEEFILWFPKLRRNPVGMVDALGALCRVFRLVISSMCLRLRIFSDFDTLRFLSGLILFGVPAISVFSCC